MPLNIVSLNVFNRLLAHCIDLATKVPLGENVPIEIENARRAFDAQPQCPTSGARANRYFVDTP